ncbi:hypothetical protein Ddye_000598 [Dipteronia dyeriana]|uniref:Uncharacterized protein n=1 Tax=Dipteronia dyeriana TaxID=168575 RepID=A0AAD9XM03_9ROSI|nr:hypothetical protein Ddye_000598 [Dipteronia dyeriana]
MLEMMKVNRVAFKELMNVGPERWSRAYSPVRRYKLMTFSIAKSMNSCLVYAHQMPITTMIEFIRDMLQKWFYKRRTNAGKTRTQLTPWATKLIKERNIQKSTMYAKKPLPDYCRDCYKTRNWVEAYARSIFPVRDPSDWNITEDVRSKVVLPCPFRAQAGRPKKKRFKSAREHGNGKTRNCMICKKSGYNRQNCMNAQPCQASPPCPSTSFATSSTSK